MDKIENIPSPADILLTSSFSLELNANDFFYYACAMSTPVSDSDYHWILNIIKKYGHDGLNACLAYIQNQEPITPWRTPKFEEAILELIGNSQKVYSDMDFDYRYNKIPETGYRTVDADVIID